ncbi:hypothetical protein NIES2104_61410 [Leptolyngbya sp. NIES-2104]|nr:hypothetical protein NIES2104_61410 [Leptolyngbya sp. NIES-2104]
MDDLAKKGQHILVQKVLAVLRLLIQELLEFFAHLDQVH